MGRRIEIVDIRNYDMQMHKNPSRLIEATRI